MQKVCGRRGADDVADAKILRGDGRAKARSGEPTGPAFRLRGPSLNGVHQKGVDAAEAESPEHAAGKGAAAFAGDEDVGASGAFGEGKIAVFLDDKLAADGNHEENTEPATEKSEWKDARKRKVGAEAQKDESGKREHDTGRAIRQPSRWSGQFCFQG